MPNYALNPKTALSQNFLNPAPPPAGSHLGGSSTNRKTRHDARAERRWGDWDDYLLLPTPFLWLESPPVMCFGDECVLTPEPIIELWP